MWTESSRYSSGRVPVSAATMIRRINAYGFKAAGMGRSAGRVKAEGMAELPERARRVGDNSPIAHISVALGTSFAAGKVFRTSAERPSDHLYPGPGPLRLPPETRLARARRLAVYPLVRKTRAPEPLPVLKSLAA